jgi:mRNA interferase RelE/StbE
MNFRVEWEQDALDSLRKLDSAIAQRILLKIDWLNSNFNIIKPIPLTGPLKGIFKLVVGDYRVLYSFTRTTGILVIRDIGHRSSIYKKEN